MRDEGRVRISTARVHDAALYARLLEDAPTTGWCPVWITSLGLDPMQVPGEPEPTLRRIASLDPAEVLAGRWPGSCLFHDDCLDPFAGVSPDLAPAADVGRAASLAAAVESVDGAPPAHLALVPVRRPADVPVTIGWPGMIDSWGDLAALCCVLRSWEDRFGAVLTRIALATIELSVAAPPVTSDRALAVAAEHYSFCHNTYHENPGSLRDYAAALVGARRWRFWWD